MDIAQPEESVETTEDVVRAEHPEAAVSAILFAMGDSVEIKKLANAIGFSEDETREIIARMKAKFDRNKDFGLTIVELDDSVQMCSKTDMYEYLIKVAKIPKNLHLSDTALETLSIIAYKQPVTRAEVEKIRGVSCDHPINKLLEFGLITELGRLNAPGRPLLFGTTEQFLRSFGVKSLEDLPDIAPDRLEEFKREAAEEIQLKLEV
ncbi:MAG: SMC-Scp complex subunit ScpB [Lachnospiraceae bacterium]|nr:SMC-Scp complex subunit ScpB [Lachnospiraceae bacterium]